jgi:uncharacterized protein (DUF302 family)
MMDVAYGFTRTLKGVSFAEARERITASLKVEGFGILTEIDIKATLKAKLDVDFRDYVILGACNPPLAHQALTIDPGVGLMLPCNVVVTVDDQGDAVVTVMDPGVMAQLVRDPAQLEAPMAGARDKIKRALANA